MTDRLMNAIFSLDAYNRGYNAAITGLSNITGTRLSTATVLSDDTSVAAVEAGFYAIAYNDSGQKVIAYRGTNIIPGQIPYPSGEDVDYGWTLGAGLGDATQALLAVDFYQAVAGKTAGVRNNPYTANIATTGHSLGGGLAGYVATLYGKQSQVYDSMAFALGAVNAKYKAVASVALGDNSLKNRIYGQYAVNDLDPSRVAASETVGQFLGFLSPVPNATYSLGESDLGPFARHSAALLVSLIYADENIVQTNWKNSSQPLWKAYFNADVAAALPAAEVRKGVDATALGTMQSAIAYSAIKGGERPFGDTGIDAMFDDAGDLGRALDSEDASLLIRDAALHIGKLVVEFAGKLAIGDVEGGTTSPYTAGVLSYNGSGILGIDLEKSLWEVGSEHSYIVGREDLIRTILLGQPGVTDISPKSGTGTGGVPVVYQYSLTDPLREALEYSFGSATNVPVDQVAIATSNSFSYGSLGTASANGVTLFGGADGDDTVTGTNGRDWMFGGRGYNWLDGGEGDDVLVGGPNADILIGGGGKDSLLAVSVNDDYGFLAGGDDDDVLRIDPRRLGADYLIGGSGNDKLYLSAGDHAWGGTGADDFYVTTTAPDGVDPQEFFNANKIHIWDFDNREDRLFVNGVLFTGATKNGAQNAAYAFALYGSPVDVGSMIFNSQLSGQSSYELAFPLISSLPYGNETQRAINPIFYQAGLYRDVSPIKGAGDAVGFESIDFVSYDYIPSTISQSLDESVSITKHPSDFKEYLSIVMPRLDQQGSIQFSSTGLTSGQMARYINTYTRPRYSSFPSRYVPLEVNRYFDEVVAGLDLGTPPRPNYTHPAADIGQLDGVDASGRTFDQIDFITSASLRSYIPYGEILVAVKGAGEGSGWVRLPISTFALPVGATTALRLASNFSTTAPTLSDGEFGASSDTILGVLRARNAALIPDTMMKVGLQDESATIGTSRNDVVTGSLANDVLLGEAGDDLLIGAEGADRLFGGTGNDMLVGGAGDDRLEGGVGNDIYRFARGDGEDYVCDSGSIGEGGVVEAGGNDRIEFAAGIAPEDVEVVQLSSTDLALRIKGTTDQIRIGEMISQPGAAIEEVRFANGATWNAAEILRRSQNQPNIIIGTQDDDILTGVAGQPNLIEGRDGNDMITGDSADDVLDGGNGNDRLFGRAGNDTLRGGDGNDQLRPGSGQDIVDGGDATWKDVVIYDDATSGVTFSLLTGGTGGDAAGDVYVGIEAAAGSNFDDTIGGSNGDDYLCGLGGADTLFGMGGDDDLRGDGGADILHGGDGNDAIFTDADDGAGDQIFGENGNDFLVGGYLDMVEGGDGDDQLQIEGSEGTYRGGDGNDAISLYRANTVGNIIDGGVGYDRLNIFDTRPVSVSAVSGIERIWSLGSGTSQLTFGGILLDLSGTTLLGNLDIRAGSNADTVLVGPSSGYNNSAIAVGLYGADGNDTLVGSNQGDFLSGGAGSDRLTGGFGNDSLDGGLGYDTAVFAGLQSDYSLVTDNGVTTIVDNAATIDGNDGTDTLVGIEIVEFKGGVQFGIGAPIVLDLNGDGVKLIERAQSGATFDWDGSGARQRTGWVDANDGILVFDRNGDGTVSGANEISFTGDKPGAKSDLDGLTAFDSNGDGQLGAGDAEWGAFKVWQDSNGNGIADTGELRSVAEAGIASISLTKTAVNRTWALGDNLTVNTGSFIRSDGTIGALGDVALAYDVGGTQHTQTVAKVAVSDPEAPSWLQWQASMFSGLSSRFRSSSFGMQYEVEPVELDPASWQAAHQMVQAMSTFGVKGGIDDGSFKSEAMLGAEPLAILDRTERYAIQRTGYNLV